MYLRENTEYINGVFKLRSSNGVEIDILIMHRMATDFRESPEEPSPSRHNKRENIVEEISANSRELNYAARKGHTHTYIHTTLRLTYMSKLR